MGTDEIPEGRMCYFIADDALYVEDKGYRASIVIENQAGHRPTGNWPYSGKVGEVMPYFWGRSLKHAQDTAAEMNRRLGLSKSDVTKIVLSSMARSPIRRGKKR